MKHVACSNEGWAKQINGHEPVPLHCDTGGANPASTKAAYAGSNRLEAVNAAVWHTTDHYGQLVLYLRMNGIVPPVSR